MDSEQLHEVYGKNGPIRLRYPLEDWIEQLLRKYPEELASIQPEEVERRSRRLYAMQRSLKEQASRRLF